MVHDGATQFQNILFKPNNYYYCYGKLKEYLLYSNLLFVGDRMWDIFVSFGEVSGAR